MPAPATPRIGRLPPTVGHLVLALASCFACSLALVGCELLAARLAPDYLVRARGIHVSSQSYGWIGRPRAVAEMGGGLVTLNERGFRGRPLALPRPAGLTRVVVLGDSIAFGYGVSDAEAFPRLLDARDDVEAANLAVQGYGPGQELLVLLHEGLRLEPDAVVLAICLRNDFADAVLPVALYNGLTPRPGFRLVGDRLVAEDRVPRSLPVRVVRWLSDHSHLYNRASALLTPPPLPASESWRRRKQEALRDEEYALRLVVAHVREMERVCRARGIAFLAATFPSAVEFAGEPALHARLRDALEQAGVRVVDFRRQFLALGLGPEAVLLDDTGHLNARGHAVAADVLGRELTAGAVRSARRD